jgi:hypothetical protein
LAEVKQMALEINLESERGDIKASVVLTIGLSRILFLPKDRSFMLLSFIDEYGNTVFNRIQMPMFMKEWEEATKKVTDKTDLILVRQVREMAEQCGSTPHLYLKFYGD